VGRIEERCALGALRLRSGPSVLEGGGKGWEHGIRLGSWEDGGWEAGKQNPSEFVAGVEL